MNTGEVYINNLDIAINYSASLIDDSFTNLLLPPDNKEYSENDMRSQPGKQIFVSNQQPKDRDVQVAFLIQCTTMSEYLTKSSNLVNVLNSGLIRLKIVPLKIEYSLTTSSYISLDSYMNGSAGKLVVKFNEPNPKNRIQL